MSADGRRLLDLLVDAPAQAAERERREAARWSFATVTEDGLILDGDTEPMTDPPTSTVEYAPGDQVVVLKGGGRMAVIGNATDPPPEPGPTTLTHSNGWSDFGSGFGGLRARLILPKVVMLSGVIKPGTLTATFATLPVSMRPTSDLLLNVRAWSNDAGDPYRLNVATTGAMSFTGLGATPSWVSLDGVTFPID